MSAPVAVAVEVVEPAACPAGTTLPGGHWAVVADGLPAERVAALDEALFPPAVDRADRHRDGVRTDGLVIVHHGEIVYERYGADWEYDERHLAWSATKTFTNVLTAIAVRDGLLTLDDPICKHVRAASPASCAVTVEHLLTFSSGWDWHETYEDASPTSSSVLSMLYGEGRGDIVGFVTRHPLRAQPGTTWQYSSGDTNVLSGVVGHVLGQVYGDRFPWPVLFDPLGMTPIWERDGSGTYVGSSYLWATPRDLARFGLFLLHDGCWNGQRLLPVGWVAASTEVSAPMRGKVVDRDPGDVQGRQIWLNKPVPDIGQVTLPWPSAPGDTFAARGHWGQSITMIPSADLVVVRTADDRDGSADFDAMLGLALALVEGR